MKGAEQSWLLAATDNHIGYMEKDPVRHNDSLEAFEEVLKIAVSQNVSELYRHYVEGDWPNLVPHEKIGCVEIIIRRPRAAQWSVAREREYCLLHLRAVHLLMYAAFACKSLYSYNYVAQS